MRDDTNAVFVGESRRIYSPDKTIARIMRLAPAMGITRVANITGLDTIGIPVYAAHRPNSRSISVAQGKGATPDSAKASALMEAVESYHAETIDLPMRLNSYVELSCSYDVVNVFALPHPGDGECVFNPHTRILWIEGDDLISGRKKFVPYEMVHLDFREPLPCGHGCFTSSSNGLASGNHMLEAMIHAICEVVETDALARWHEKSQAQQNQEKLDLSTVADPRCCGLLLHLQEAQTHVGVWDITGDIGIPAFLCHILPPVISSVSGIRPASGVGCHPSRNIALLRAVTEAAQSRLTFISGVRDDLSRESYKRSLSEAEYRIWRERILYTPPACKNFGAIISHDTSSLNQDMDVLLQRLRKGGIDEVVAVDLTKAEFGIPVVRVIIPGLRGTMQ